MTEHTHTPQFVAYVRVSTVKQGDNGLSLGSQKIVLRDHVDGLNGNIIGEFVEVASGGKNDRIELAKAIDLAKQTGATLIVEKLDRLGRDTEKVLSIYRELKGNLLLLDVPTMDNEANFKFLLTMLGGVAELERNLASARAIAIHKYKREVQGYDHGARLRELGKVWPKSANDRSIESRRLAITNDSSRKQALAIAGPMRRDYTMQEIADKLNEVGLSTPRGKAYNVSAVQNLFKQKELILAEAA